MTQEPGSPNSLRLTMEPLTVFLDGERHAKLQAIADEAMRLPDDIANTLLNAAIDEIEAGTGAARFGRI